MDDTGTLIGLIIAGLSVLLPLLCTLLVFAGLGVGGWFAWRAYQRAKVNTIAEVQASQVWPATTGTVIKSRVEVSGGEYTSVHARVHYEYTVNGKTYQNDQVRVDDRRLVKASRAQDPYDVVERYPVGASVTVFYNPANPSESALER